jgi:hypothetical protein
MTRRSLFGLFAAAPVAAKVGPVLDPGVVVSGNPTLSSIAPLVDSPIPGFIRVLRPAKCGGSYTDGPCGTMTFDLIPTEEYYGKRRG